jgi:hypothetical protein
VDLLGAPGAGAAGKISLFHQNGLQPTGCGVLSDSRARDSAADDKEICRVSLIYD